MGTAMNKTEVSSHVSSVEALRKRWIARMKPAIARQVQPIRDTAKEALTGAPDAATTSQRVIEALEVSRADWIDLFTHLYEQVGVAFATHAMKPLAQRADVKLDLSPSGSLQQSILSYVARYGNASIPNRVDRMLASFARGMSAVLVAPPLKAAVQMGGWEIKGTSSVGADDPPVDPVAELDQMFDDAVDQVTEMETVTASNMGPLAGAHSFADENGITLVKTWQAVQDDRTRESHAEADGQVQQLDDPFEVGGSELLFPMDESLGADIGEIIYCRCVVTFDPEEEKSQHVDDYVSPLVQRQRQIRAVIRSGKWNDEATEREIQKILTVLEATT